MAEPLTPAEQTLLTELLARHWATAGKDALTQRLASHVRAAERALLTWLDRKLQRNRDELIREHLRARDFFVAAGRDGKEHLFEHGRGARRFARGEQTAAPRPLRFAPEDLDPPATDSTLATLLRVSGGSAMLFVAALAQLFAGKSKPEKTT